MRSRLLTQVKGAQAAPTLDFALPADEVAGTAFIASTAVGEVAQESAAIGGSFFTHHLEAALRGAADTDADGLVTLGEAFSYTAAQTKSGTSVTTAGPQHPTYHLKMAGRGEVVLAFLRHGEAKLRLPADPDASYVVRGQQSFLIELGATSAATMLALPAGRYVVERRSDSGRATASITLAPGDAKLLPRLAPTRYEIARSKGGPPPGLLLAGAGVVYVPLSRFGVAPAVHLGVRKEIGPVGLRLAFEYAYNEVEDHELRYRYQGIGAEVSAYWPINTHAILAEIGPTVGYTYATQRLGDRRQFASAMLHAGAALMVTAPAGPVRVGLESALVARAFTLNGERTARPAGSAGLLVLFGF